MSQKVFEHTKHKKLWDYLADNPGTVKEEAFKIFGWEHFHNCCFACAAGMTFDSEGYVHNCGCPLEWPAFDGECSGPEDGHYYRKWANATELLNAVWTKSYDRSRHGDQALEAVTMARRIRDLPLSNRASGLEVV